MKEKVEEKKARVLKILARLKKVYPRIRCAIHFSNPWELLVATMLSAQCTDKRVNLVTPSIFKRYRTVREYAMADRKEFEDAIRSTGFYRNKARNILLAAREVLDRFGGKVPARMEDLVTLPGVGRKTANVVLGNAFGIPGLSVDTHMIRLNRRLGLTRHADPVKIELDLMRLVPKKDWTVYSSSIIRHGRVRCSARRPDCACCEIKTWCPSSTVKV